MANCTIGHIQEKVNILDIIRVIERTYCTFVELEPVILPNTFTFHFTTEEGDFYTIFAVEGKDVELFGSEESFFSLSVRQSTKGYQLIRTIISHFGGKVQFVEGNSDWESIQKREPKILNMKINEHKNLKINFY